jgi:cytochrome c oxidase subunit 3
MIAAIVMMFAALSSAYIVLSGGPEWRPVQMPGVFIFSTGAILASSATMHHARRLLAREDFAGQSRWLAITLLLGLLFLGAQLLGWRQLIAQGAFLAGNPHSSFFYLFTGAHGVHLVGGLTALSYLAVRSRRKLVGVGRERQLAASEAISLYWHFMDGLWVCLFLLLLLWK